MAFGKGQKKSPTFGQKLDEQTSKIDINRRAQKTLIRIIVSALYDAMKTGLTEESQDIVNSDQKEQIKRITERFNPEQSADKIADAYKNNALD